MFPIARVKIVALATLMTLAALAGGASPALGVSFTVDATHDAVDATPGDGVCADVGGACTLRAAVMETNALAGADAISLPAGTYVLTIAPGPSPESGPFFAAEGDLEIRDDLTVVGSGAPSTLVDGGHLDRVFEVQPQAQNVGAVAVEIGELTIQNGAPHGNAGGGLITWGKLTLSNSIVTGNSGIAISVRGTLNLKDSVVSDNPDGGIYSQGTLTIVRTTISGNTNSFGGGGIWATGEVVIVDSILAGNSAGCCGYGGAANFFAATVNISNATISGNSAGCFGGGLASFGVSDGPTIEPTLLTLTNVTLTDNSNDCSTQGGNIYNQETSSARLVNTIVSNGGIGGDCSGPITSLGHNLDSDGTCGFSGPGDLSNVDPKLGPLADNAGPTQTHALLDGSPAIDAGDNAACPAFDQRGIVRPEDGDNNGVALCDIGAYELPAVDGAITVVNDAIPDTATLFAFGVTGVSCPPYPCQGFTFNLADDVSGTIPSQTSFPVGPGTIRVQQTSTPAGWRLETIACSDGSRTDLVSQSAFIELAVGEEVRCVFTNRRDAGAPGVLPPSGGAPGDGFPPGITLAALAIVALVAALAMRRGHRR